MRGCGHGRGGGGPHEAEDHELRFLGQLEKGEYLMGEERRAGLGGVAAVYLATVV